MSYTIKFAPPAERYIKKIKDNKLKALLKEKILLISENPYIGELKSGDLAGYYALGFKYNRTDYRIAYSIYEDVLTIVVILIGTRENFYEELKNYVK